jgi:hypothetical protein
MSDGRSSESSKMPEKKPDDRAGETEFEKTAEGELLFELL